MKIVFCGGGTMGHISPALAVAEYIRKHEENADVLFVGRKDGDENKYVKQCGIDVYEIEIYGIQRKLTLQNISNIICAMKAQLKSKQILRKFNPDVVVGTGGYVSWPVLKSAQQLKIPTLIHESNAVPGMVTKLLSKKCDKVLLNLKGSEKNFSDSSNIRIVGNPVREDFLKFNRISSRKTLGIKNNEKFILSFGGSGGSEKMNRVIIETMNNISRKTDNVRHTHATGKRYYKNFKNLLEIEAQKSGKFQVVPYIENMPLYLSAADIVISRCGAMSLSEICATKIPSILIPSPNVTGNHQYENAKLISEAGGSILIEEVNLTVNTLSDSIFKLLKNEELRRKMSLICNKFYVKNSTSMFVEEIKNTIRADM